MTFLLENLIVAALALFLERFIGYPGIFYRLIRHPVVWIGWLIHLFDRLFNRPHLSSETRKLFGTLMVIAILFFTVISTGLIVALINLAPLAVFLKALLATTLLSQKSLYDHVNAVYRALDKGLEEGRTALSHIVGRDTKNLSEDRIANGAIESLAENASDGIVAPFFWLFLLGLPGAALYKAINTMDSMVGYKNEKYLAFGFAAAKLDDVVNYLPARVCGFLFAVCAFISRKWDGQSAFLAMHRDAPNHVSPNAGWPEAAMAGALGLSLGGPRDYGGRTVKLPFMGHGRKILDRRDIKDALSLYRRAMSALILLVSALAAFLFYVPF